MRSTTSAGRRGGVSSSSMGGLPAAPAECCFTPGAGAGAGGCSLSSSSLTSIWSCRCNRREGKIAISLWTCHVAWSGCVITGCSQFKSRHHVIWILVFNCGSLLCKMTPLALCNHGLSLWLPTYSLCLSVTDRRVSFPLLRFVSQHYESAYSGRTSSPAPDAAPF